MPHVPDFHLICQVERHGLQFAKAFAHWQTPEVGQQLLLVFCKAKVRTPSQKKFCCRCQVIGGKRKFSSSPSALISSVLSRMNLELGGEVCCCRSRAGRLSQHDMTALRFDPVWTSSQGNHVLKIDRLHHLVWFYSTDAYNWKYFYLLVLKVLNSLHFGGKYTTFPPLHVSNRFS